MDKQRAMMEGFVLIKDANTGEILVDKKNAVHFENMSEAISLALAHRSAGYIHEMVFGNGASTVSGTGAVTYFPPNASGSDAQLYNQTYRKVVDNQSSLNTDKQNSRIAVQHADNNIYTDIIVTCTLAYNEPSDQEAFDDGTDMESSYVFDEIGLKAFDEVPSNGKLLTHVIFHPIQKTLNCVIEIVYTLRIYMT